MYNNSKTTLEQLILFHLLEYYYNDNEDNEDYTVHDMDVLVDSLNIYCLCYKNEQQSLDNNDNKQGSMDKIFHDINKEIIAVIISILSKICAQIIEKQQQENTQNNNEIGHEQLINLLIEVLNDKKFHHIHHLKSNVMKIFSNLFYKNKRNQEIIRNIKNGIISILNATKIDDMNPYIREWSVFTIRNITESNIQNQNVILELRAQGVVDMPILNKAGLKVELNKETGKPKIVSKKENETSSS